MVTSVNALRQLTGPMRYSRRMKEPTLKVIGVYRPVISAETWREQFQVTGDEQATREHFENLVLIEAVVEELTGLFDFSKFGQVLSGYRDYPDNMQVGYDPALLSADGECLTQRRMHCVQGTGPLRFAVYLHFYDPTRPLLWQGGEVTCPSVEEAPVRLMMLMPYRACS